MAIKNNPGAFDCYAKAAPDEPMFVLLGRDPAASATIERWIELRSRFGPAPGPAVPLDPQLVEAQACADSCASYARSLGKALVPVVGEDQRARIHRKLDEFLDRVERELPDVEDGNEGEFELRGGVCGYGEDGGALLDFAVTVSFTENNV